MNCSKEWKFKSFIISTNEDPSSRIESSAVIIDLRGVSTKLSFNLVFKSCCILWTDAEEVGGETPKSKKKKKELSVGEDETETPKEKKKKRKRSEMETGDAGEEEARSLKKKKKKKSLSKEED